MQYNFACGCDFQRYFNLKLANDGTLNQDRDGISLVSSCFTKTVPVNQIGRLDYFKMVAISNSPIILEKDSITKVNFNVSGQQFFHQGTPFPSAFAQRINNIDSDYRLAHAGIMLYYPDLDTFQGFAITNDTIYATFGTLGLRSIAAFIRARGMTAPNGMEFPFPSWSYDCGNVWGRTENICGDVPYWNTYCNEYLPSNQRVQMNALPISWYDSNYPLDYYHDLTLECNPSRDLFCWYINQEKVHQHIGILNAGEPKYRVLNRYGDNGRATPRRAYIMMGNFSMLDHLLYVNNIPTRLVALTAPQEYLTTTKDDNSSYQHLNTANFAITDDVPQYRIFGQGACLNVKKITITKDFPCEETECIPVLEQSFVEDQCDLDQ